jgi:hypothetical protein
MTPHKLLSHLGARLVTPAAKVTPPTLAALARAEILAYFAYTHALEAYTDALRRQIDGHRVEDAPRIHAAKLGAGRAWMEAMDATDAALVAAGRAPIGVATPRGPALEALIQEEASP